MKTTRKLMLVLSVVLLAAPLTLGAMSLERAYIESYRGRTDIPVPIKVVSPDVDSEYAGTTVELVFTVGPAGAPQNIEVRTPVTALSSAEEARTVAEGKKIHWYDGLEAIWTLLRYRFKRLPAK